MEEEARAVAVGGCSGGTKGNQSRTRCAALLQQAQTCAQVKVLWLKNMSLIHAVLSKSDHDSRLDSPDSVAVCTASAPKEVAGVS